MTAPHLRVATRGSPLARWQAEHVTALLQAAHPGLQAELVLVETTGDRRTDAPISALGGQGVFVKEVEQAVLDDRADLAVHSAKDLTSTTAPGLVLAAVPERGDPRDALVGQPLGQLAQGATVATGSARRRHQLGALRPDLTFVELRGNIGTRLERVPDGGAIVMAAVALERLGLAEHIAELLEPEVMVPQVAQGALAIECREDDEATHRLLSAIEHEESRLLVDAERAFLAELGGGCDLPVGAYATFLGQEVELRSFLAGSGGVWRGRTSGPAEAASRWAREEAGRALAVTRGHD
jgi:hydroxymethylbilane synthase